jgi:hypothetical protein
MAWGKIGRTRSHKKRESANARGVEVINILQQVVNKSGGYHRPLLLIRSFVRTEARNVLPPSSYRIKYFDGTLSPIPEYARTSSPLITPVPNKRTHSLTYGLIIGASGSSLRLAFRKGSTKSRGWGFFRTDPTRCNVCISGLFERWMCGVWGGIDPFRRSGCRHQADDQV